jgi:hypothetical protein
VGGFLQVVFVGVADGLDVYVIELGTSRFEARAAAAGADDA